MTKEFQKNLHNFKKLEDDVSRREVMKVLGLGALALSMPLHLLPMSQAQANPLIFLLRLLPFFGRRTLVRAASRGIIGNAARAATSRQVIRSTALGSGSLLGTASTAYAAYDVLSMVSMFSEPVQEAVEEYQYHPSAREKKIGMIWDADEPNTYWVTGKNYAETSISDRLILSIYDIKKEKYISRSVIGALDVPAGGVVSYQDSPILRLPRTLKAGDMIVLDIHLENSTDNMIFEPTDVIVIERT